MTMLRTVFLALALPFVLAACSTGGGSTAYDYSGAWTGTREDSRGFLATETVTLTQDGSDVGGTWQSVSSEGTFGGTVLGVVNGNEVVIEFFPSQVNLCPFRAVLTRNGDTLSGTYAAFNCTASLSGTITISR